MDTLDTVSTVILSTDIDTPSPDFDHKKVTLEYIATIFGSFKDLN